MESIELIGKKHRIVYIELLVATGALVALLLVLGTVRSGDLRPYSKWFLALAAIVLLRAAFKWLRLRSIAWVVTAEDVIVKGGWLPWTKSQFTVPVDSIFEAYYSIGFWAKVLNYGHCTIRRTEGTTSSFRETYLARPKELVGLINQKVRDFKKRQVRPGTAPPVNEVDELKSLAALKANGSITGAEFDAMKQRIITRATALSSPGVSQ